MNKATLMAKLDRLLVLLAAPYMPLDASNGSGPDSQASDDAKPPLTLVSHYRLYGSMTLGPWHRKVPPF